MLLDDSSWQSEAPNRTSLFFLFLNKVFPVSSTSLALAERWNWPFTVGHFNRVNIKGLGSFQTAPFFFFGLWTLDCVLLWINLFSGVFWCVVMRKRVILGNHLVIISVTVLGGGRVNKNCLLPRLLKRSLSCIELYGSNGSDLIFSLLLSGFEAGCFYMSWQETEWRTTPF